MPLAKLSIPSDLPQSKARALADAVHEGLVETCDVPPKDRFQLICRYEANAMIIDPTFPNVSRSSEASIVEILFIEGRSIEQKARLFRRIAERAASVGFRGDDIMISVTENAASDWSAGNGLSFADL